MNAKNINFNKRSPSESLDVLLGIQGVEVCKHEKWVNAKIISERTHSGLDHSHYTKRVYKAWSMLTAFRCTRMKRTNTNSLYLRDIKGIKIPAECLSLLRWTGNKPQLSQCRRLKLHKEAITPPVLPFSRSLSFPDLKGISMMWSLLMIII